MYVRVVSFGTNWWAMNSHDTSDPYCFRRRAAWFNAAALMSGRRLHHSAIFPGQVRFNSKSGFDPEFPLRAIGKTFLCSEPRQFAGKMHLLFERRTSETMPDACLVTLRSSEHGAIQFGKPGWKSARRPVPSRSVCAAIGTKRCCCSETRIGSRATSDDGWSISPDAESG